MRSKLDLIESIVEPDSPLARHWGFTPDLFGGYLWKGGQTVQISFIVSWHEGQGNFRRLIEAILYDGFTVQVPTPFGRIRMILERLGFEQKYIEDEKLGMVEVMEKSPEGIGDGKRF